ncbi:GNAT family N-acetyltransferase [Panacibacter ginsenosidivorans]|uniref:GNAT family N-acetyltransferase n=1 Tax=Panacibacter ginsenosidivorans TaxID=1813871 RepID=A0A5B8VD97_9BACT|nr:GNAT family N-acetyltransferase [Panacibacter ginsenosidivorans]QEC68941.1 GNAT family N-acetyltransferase [Panacibacter ginsenosidivorans]
MREIVLKNNSIVNIRLLNKDDAEPLFQYLESLSAESRSRFGPHAFDRETVTNICNNLDHDDGQRFIAVANNRIVAYMLTKRGMLDADAERYAQHNLFFDAATTITYAPSVADDFQNTGLGTKMFTEILQQLKQQSCKTIILWGGVQASNARAVHFYEKHGFEPKGNFWFDEKDNIDMLLNI